MRVGVTLSMARRAGPSDPVARMLTQINRMGDRVGAYFAGALRPNGAHWIPSASSIPTAGTQVLGPEILSTPGGPFTAVGNWSGVNGGSVALAGSDLQVTSTAAANAARGEISLTGLVKGATYQVVVRARLGTAASAVLQTIGDSTVGWAISGSIVPVVGTNSANYSFQMTAASASGFLQFITDGTGTMFLVSASIKQIYTVPMSPWLMDYVESTMSTAASVDGPIGALTDGSATGTALAVSIRTTNQGSVTDLGGGVYKFTYTANSSDPFVEFQVPLPGAAAGRQFLTTWQVWTDAGQPLDAALFSYAYPSISEVSGPYYLLPTSALTTTSYRTFSTATDTQLSLRYDAKELSASGGYFYFKYPVVHLLTGRHATQAAGANKPTLRRGVVNLQPQSATLASQWTVNGAATPTNNTSTDPNGAMLASTLVLAAGSLGVYWSTPNGIAASTQCTQATLVKRTAGASIRMQLGWDTSGGWIKVNPQTMTLLAQGSNVTAVSSLSVGNGYTLFAWNFSVPVANPAFVYYNDDTNSLTLAVAGTGLFVGTYTASQIHALGGIPLTTTLPVGSSGGNYGLEFSGGANSLNLPAQCYQMSDDHAVIVGFVPHAVSSCVAAPSCSGNNRFGAIAISNSSQLLFEWYDGTTYATVTAAQALGVPLVATAMRRGNTLYGRRNGVQIGTAAAFTTSVSANSGVLGSGPVGAFKGVKYFSIVVRGPMSDAELRVFEHGVAALTGAIPNFIQIQ